MKDSPIIELCKEDYKKLWEFLTPATDGHIYRNPTCDRENFTFLGATFVWRGTGGTGHNCSERHACGGVCDFNNGITIRHRCDDKTCLLRATSEACEDIDRKARAAQEEARHRHWEER